MILIDFNQIMIMNLTTHLSYSKDTEIQEDLVRHMVLNSLRVIRNKFKKEYGELVICCDDRNYWRKDIFKYYKASRKENQKKSSIDWTKLFRTLEKIREEIKINLPYRVLQQSRCEADDIIATLCHRFGKQSEQILIVSRDKDFVQLQMYDNVRQWEPKAKKYIVIDSPKKYLKEHIIKGDFGDGIPNILSADDCIVSKTKQRPIQKSKLEEWISTKPEEFCTTDMKAGWDRNNALINLYALPKWVISSINETYDSTPVPSRNKLQSYFIKNRLRNLQEHIMEF